EVSLTGPTTAVVGSDAQFNIRVVNRGNAVATKVVVSDRFDAGLEHPQAKGAIEHDLADLPPGREALLSVNFHISRTGELCQEITVTAAGAAAASTRSCLTVVDVPSQPAEPTAEPQPTAPATPGEPGQPTPPGEGPTPAKSQLTVTKRGPQRRRVGE